MPKISFPIRKPAYMQRRHFNPVHTIRLDNGDVVQLGYYTSKPVVQDSPEPLDFAELAAGYTAELHDD